MSLMKFLGPHLIVSHQEPTGKSLFQAMEPVAGRSLGNLS